MKTTTPTENPNNPENIAADMRAAPSAGPFLPFVPLKPSADSLPSFPVECLPPKLRTYVEAVAVHTQLLFLQNGSGASTALNGRID